MIIRSLIGEDELVTKGSSWNDFNGSCHQAMIV